MITRGVVSDVRGPFPGAQAQDGLDVRDVLLRRWSHRVCEVREVSNSHVVQVQHRPAVAKLGVRARSATCQIHTSRAWGEQL